MMTAIKDAEGIEFLPTTNQAPAPRPVPPRRHYGRTVACWAAAVAVVMFAAGVGLGRLQRAHAPAAAPAAVHIAEVSEHDLVLFNPDTSSSHLFSYLWSTSCLAIGSTATYQATLEPHRGWLVEGTLDPGALVRFSCG